MCAHRPKYLNEVIHSDRNAFDHKATTTYGPQLCGQMNAKQPQHCIRMNAFNHIGNTYQPQLCGRLNTKQPQYCIPMNAFNHIGNT